MKKPSGRHPLEFKTVRKSYGDLQVIDGFSANLERGEKIALLGRNGADKTTLIRNAPGFIDESERHFGVDGGTVRWGHEVAVGYSGGNTRSKKRLRPRSSNG
jgi:ATPase subunit of ABC transporter with duplicated ATPase domains